MLQVKCIEKFRDKHNIIVGYRLQDSQGNIRDIKPNQLKEAMINKKIDVENLTLTSDNRLVGKLKTEKHQLSKEEAMILKAKSLGCQVVELGYINRKIYILKNNADAIYLIPDTTKKVPEINWDSLGITGLIKVTGGKSLDSTENMFKGCKASSFDFSSFNTSNVMDMTCMFSHCKYLKSLDLRNFNTSKVISMAEMFCGCKNLESLDLSSFDTSQVKAMGDIFYDCIALENVKGNDALVEAFKQSEFDSWD